MVLDRERLLLRFKQELLVKGSWGQRELLALLVQLEAECAVEEPPADRLWRLYGAELEELFTNRVREGRGAANDDVAGVAAVPTKPAHRDAEEARWQTQEPRSAPALS